MKSVTVVTPQISYRLMKYQHRGKVKILYIVLLEKNTMIINIASSGLF